MRQTHTWHHRLQFVLFAGAFLFLAAGNLTAQNGKAKNIRSENSSATASSQGSATTQLKTIDPLPKPLVACGDMGAENGWSQWQAFEGYHQYGGSANPTFFAPIAGPPPAPRFNLTAGAGVDPCTQGTTGPPVPFICPFPGFGIASIQIGQPNTSGLNGGCASSGLYPPPGIGAAGNGCSEKITIPFSVGVQNIYFSYAYAIVVENPAGGHTTSEAPFAEIYILDANGDTVQCSHEKYVADLAGGVGPGFFAASCTGSINPPPYGGNGMIVSYKPWTKVGIDLSKYLYQNLTVVITNSDCALGGHFCYSYWDFACTPLPVTPVPYCVGSATSISAPAGYTYQWFQNGAAYTGQPNSTSQTIAPVPQPIDTFVVHISKAALCDSHITYVMVPMSITPDFNYNAVGSCGSGLVNFTDSSYAPNGTPMVSWNWSFPGGTPSTSTVQNPSNISYAPGTYTATLIVTSQQGCTDTISLPLIVTSGIPPVAAASTFPVCFNNPTVFQDLSTGNPNVQTWAWDFGDPASGAANTSALQNPSHIYGAAGTFTVTLIITNTGGCKDTVQITTTVNPLPVANFSTGPVCLGDTTCFQDLSTVTPGTISTWSWNFGDPASGAANTATIQNPCHLFSGAGTFTVLLTVTSDSGCQAIKALTASVNPAPVAGIIPQNVCLNALTSIQDGSVPAPGDPLATWDWDFGDGSAHSGQQNPTHTYPAGGSYTLTLIVTSQNGCKDTVSKPLNVYNPPVASFAKPDSGCAPICVSYNDLSTSVDGTVSAWQWNFPGASPAGSTSSSPQNICYTTPGNYSVSLLVTSSFGCKDSITLPMINVFPWPKANFCVAPALAPATYPVFSFCDMWSQDVVQWSWDFGDNTTDLVNTDPVHSYSATASQNDFYAYNICLKVQNQHGCWDTICKVVELVPEFTFYIPNTFTPNSDFNNEFFFGKCRGVKEYNIWLFDRWGNMLWDCHHSGKNTDWDGPGQDGLSSFCKWDGKIVQGGMDMSGSSRLLAQEDVYVWKVELTDIFDKRHTYVGHVNIVR